MCQRLRDDRPEEAPRDEGCRPDAEMPRTRTVAHRRRREVGEARWLRCAASVVRWDGAKRLAGPHWFALGLALLLLLPVFAETAKSTNALAPYDGTRNDTKNDTKRGECPLRTLLPF